MVITRSPLEAIGMNGAGTQKRRSARLSHEGNGENEPPSKKTKVNGAQTTTVSTKEQDGDNNAATKRRSKKGKHDVKTSHVVWGRRNGDRISQVRMRWE